MSEIHTIIKLYYQETCPDQDMVVAALKACEDPLDHRDMLTIASLAARSRHGDVLFDHIFPKCERGAKCGEILASTLSFNPGNWVAAREGWVDKLDHTLPGWTEDLVTAGEDGWSGWDLLMNNHKNCANSGHPYLNEHVLLARIASMVEQHHPSIFHKPHPALPDASCAQVWAWMWACIPSHFSRLPHWGYLLSCNIDPDFAMSVEGGCLSLGTALLWGVHPGKSIPKILRWDERPYYSPNPPEFAKWIKYTSGTKEFDFEFPWHALWMLRQAGMDPGKLKEPTVWGTPALGILARRSQGEGNWTYEEFKKVFDRWLALDLDMGATSLHGKTLLDVVAGVVYSINHIVLAPLYPLPYWRIDAEQWHRAATPEAMARFFVSPMCLRLMDDEPRIKVALMAKLSQGIDAWVGGEEPPISDALISLIGKIDERHPLTPLSELVIAHIQSQPIETLVRSVMDLSLHILTPGMTSKNMDVLSTHTQRVSVVTQLRITPLPSDQLRVDLGRALIKWANSECKEKPTIPRKVVEPDLTEDELVIKQEREKNPSDPRAIVTLYTESSRLEFNTWSDTRQANDAVKAWRTTLITNKEASGARRLSLAQPALDGLADLRDGFPHFEDVLRQIEDHLSLALRGDGSFSLPPLLMAGPPGTGKTFFFQELASKVNTTYRVLNMESITAGFSIVGMDTGWGDAAPGIVFDTLIAREATANPILLLDEIDKVPIVSNSPVAPTLLGLLEPHSARKFSDRCIQLHIDASRINWVATANDLSRVDLPLLSRFNVVHVANPDYYARRAMSQHIYKALTGVHSWGASFEPKLSEEVIQVLARPANAARDLRKNIMAALATAARAQRGYIVPGDIPPSMTARPLSPWDAPLPETPVSHSHCSPMEKTHE